MTLQERISADVQRMKNLLEKSDEELQKAGFTTPRSILIDDFRCGVFHDIHPRYGYETVYVYDVQAVNKAYDNLTRMYAQRQIERDIQKQAEEMFG